MFGKNVLSKTEKKHLRDNGCTTLYLFRKTRSEQKALEKQFPNTTACWQCDAIARKLKLED